MIPQKIRNKPCTVPGLSLDLLWTTYKNHFLFQSTQSNELTT
jgi:hypothetical protein